MSSPTPSSPAKITPETLAAAAQRRAAQTTELSPEAQSIHEYDLRLSFRRLIDPGITRPNSKDTAASSLKVAPKLSGPLNLAHHAVFPLDTLDHI